MAATIALIVAGTATDAPTVEDIVASDVLEDRLLLVEHDAYTAVYQQVCRYGDRLMRDCGNKFEGWNNVTRLWSFRTVGITTCTTSD